MIVSEHCVHLKFIQNHPRHIPIVYTKTYENSITLIGIENARRCVAVRAVRSCVNVLFVAWTVGSRTSIAMVRWFGLRSHVCKIHHIDPRCHYHQRNEFVHLWPPRIGFCGDYILHKKNRLHSVMKYAILGKLQKTPLILSTVTQPIEHKNGST